MTLDDKILLLFNGHHSPPIDSLMVFLSARNTWIPFYLALAILLLYRMGWKRGLLMIAGCLLAVGLADYISASIIRPAVQRLRPPFSDIAPLVKTVSGEVPRSFSFPSCHAANSFAAAVFLMLAYRKRWFTAMIMTWAVIHSLTRLYLGVHFPSDIVAGAVIGAIFGAVSYIACSSCIKKFLLLLPLLIAVDCHASEKLKFEYGGEFTTVFDNREGGGHHTDADTYFFTRLAPEIGFSLADGRHSVMGGVVWTQPIGCQWDGHRLSPVLYYRYRRKGIAGYMGMFPRTSLIEPLPDYLESDSTRYAQYTIRGAMIQYRAANGFFESFIDWRGMRGEHRREAFSIVARGRWQGKYLQAGATAMLNHLAKQYNPPPGQDVVDNIVANPYAAIDLCRAFPAMKTLSLQAGPILTLTRDRNDGQWIAATGVRAQLNVEWWRIGLNNSFTWANKPLYPLWGRFGPLLNDGEPYLAAKCYNRTELYGILCKYKEIVQLRAELDFHTTPGDFMFYQRLTVIVKI